MIDTTLEYYIRSANYCYLIHFEDRVKYPSSSITYEETSQFSFCKF